MAAACASVNTNIARAWDLRIVARNQRPARPEFCPHQIAVVELDAHRLVVTWPAREARASVRWRSVIRSH
jgi:hypothetical protein